MEMNQENLIVNDRMLQSASHVQREQILENILGSLSDCLTDFHAICIEIVGEGGTGKTTILNQTEKYFAENGIFSQIIRLQGISSFSLLDALSNFAKQNGFASIIPTISEKESQNEGNVIRIIRELLIQLQDSRKDIFIIQIDDAHLLSQDAIEQVRKVFDIYFTGSRIAAILSGRHGFESDSAIQIGEFSTSEFKQYLDMLFADDWSADNEDIVIWLDSLTDRKPYFVALILEYLIEKGIVSSGYVAPLDLLKNTPFPQSLLDALSVRYSLEPLHENSLAILNILSCASKSLSANEIFSLTKLDQKIVADELKWLIQNRWLMERDGFFFFVHPMVQELIFRNIENVEKTHELFLSSKIKLTTSEKSFHIQKLSNLSHEHEEILLEHIKELMQQGLFFSANRLYQILDPEGKNTEYSLQVGKNYFRIGRMDSALKILLGASERNFKNRWEVLCYIGRIYRKRSDYENAVKYLTIALDFANLTDEARWKLMLTYAFTLAYKRDNDKLSNVLDCLKQNSEKSEQTKMEYYELLSSIDSRFPLEIDTEKWNLDGLEIAKKLHDNTRISVFLTCLQLHYHHQGDYKKAIEFGDFAIEYAKKDYNILSELNAFKIKTITYGSMDNFSRAISMAKRVIEMMESRGETTEIVTFVHLLGSYYVSIGYLPLAENTFRKLREMLGQNPTVDLNAKIQLGRWYLNIEDCSKAEKIFTEAMHQAENLKMQATAMLAKMGLVPCIYQKDGEKANSYIEEAVEYFTEYNLKNFLPHCFYGIGLYFVRQGLVAELEKLLEQWAKSQPSDEMMHFKVITILYEFLCGNERNGKIKLRRLEESFCGNHLFDYYHIYRWLAENEHSKHKNNERYRFLHQAIKSICHVDKNVEISSYYGVKSPFFRLIENWTIALQKDCGLSQSVIDRLAQDDEQRSIINESLSFWDISLAHLPEMQFGNNNPLIINLFGSHAIFVGNKRLSKKDWGYKFSMLVLLYLITKGWATKSKISANSLIHDVINPDPEHFERSKKSLYSAISRINRISDNQKLILRTGGTLEFNWDLDNLHLDIQRFQISSENGLRDYSNGLYDSATVHLDLCYRIYNGRFAQGFDRAWIDPLREYFHQRFCKIVGALVSIYKEHGDDEEFLTHLLEKFSNDNSFSESLMAYFVEQKRVEEVRKIQKIVQNQRKAYT